MFSISRIFFIILVFNGLILVLFYGAAYPEKTSASSMKLDSTKNFLVRGESAGQEENVVAMQEQLRAIAGLLKEAQDELEKVKKITDSEPEEHKKSKKKNNKKKSLKKKSNKKKSPKKKSHKKKEGNKKKKVVLRKNKAEPRSPFKAIIETTDFNGSFTRETNPFYLLGAYPTPVIPLPYGAGIEQMKYDQLNYGLFNDADYCERVDYYNLARPFNIFERKNFLTDYAKNTVPRHDIIPKLGKNVMRHFSKYSKDAINETKYHLDKKITNFFINSDGFHKHHEIGKNFLCATQMYNHIPGQRALIRKDELIESVDRHAKKFESKPQCFNKEMFFPLSYRLYIQEECKEFIDIINSPEYIASLETEPIQYLVKIGHGSHSGNGVFLLDKNQTEWLNANYEFGSKCGNVTEPWIAQKYVSNPLLLDIDNKFDFRVYMVIASTNPLMVYYHDGVLRASLSPYDKFSQERGKHLTNSHLAKSVFEAAKTKKVYNMTEQELRDYHLWSFGELQDYLLESGKVTDPKWLDNHLRPQFRKAMIHIVKMSSQFFWKQSNVYGLFGLDFMLDDKMNLWFIEANPNPQLKTINDIFSDVLFTLVEGMFEISFNLYRSRMKRALGLIQRIQEENSGNIDYSKYIEEYQEVIKNKFEPEYQLNYTNKYVMIMDESIPGADAYFGNIEPDCAEFFDH